MICSSMVLAATLLASVVMEIVVLGAGHARVVVSTRAFLVDLKGICSPAPTGGPSVFLTGHCRAGPLFP